MSAAHRFILFSAGCLGRRPLPLEAALRKRTTTPPPSPSPAPPAPQRVSYRGPFIAAAIGLFLLGATITQAVLWAGSDAMKWNMTVAGSSVWVVAVFGAMVWAAVIAIRAHIDEASWRRSESSRDDLVQADASQARRDMRLQDAIEEGIER